MTTHVTHAAGLGDVSKSLQALHKHLLEFQADQLGFFGSPLQLFERATKDIAFAWLKPLRDGIVTLDERRADDAPISDAEAKAFGDQFSALIEAESGPFRNKLNQAFQSHPDTIWALIATRKSLSALA